MSEALLSSHSEGSGSSATGWGFLYSVLNKTANSQTISIPDEVNSFILLNVVYSDTSFYNVTFGFQNDSYGGDRNRPLFLNRSDNDGMYIRVHLLTSNLSKISREYTISNTSNGIHIARDTSSDEIVWRFHFLVLPFELTRY